MKKQHLQAFGVHLFTATGAGIALFAMLEAGNQNWTAMFLWLLLALVVDGIDGPLARKYQVKTYASEWDGALMDLIIDYLTYAFIPAYALTQSGILPVWEGWFAAIFITLTTVIYFSDTRMKTADNSFSGFPGCWNMVVLVFFALTPAAWVMLLIIVALGVLQFFSIHFIHPVRTERLRKINLCVMFIWTATAFWIGMSDFIAPTLAQIILTISSLYLLLIGAILQFTRIGLKKN